MKRVYAEIDKFSQLSWAQKSVHELYWNNGRQNTRSGTRTEDKQESIDWEKNNKAQIGYGEITRVSILFIFTQEF